MSYRSGAPRVSLLPSAPAGGRLAGDQSRGRPARALAGVLPEGEAWVPTVDLVDPPRIRIYDPTDPRGGYWYRGIGFTSRIQDP